MDEPSNSKPAASGGNSRVVKLIAGLAVLATIIALLRLPAVRDALQGALDRIETLGPWAPVVFVLLYICATVLLVPGTILTLGAGAVFGVVHGSIIVSIAATLGASAAFLVGRFVARDRVRKRIADNPKFTAIDEAVAREGWKIVGLTRLSPVFPFTLLNYAFSLTGVSFRHYVFASWIGMLPGTVMYVYLGSLAKLATDERERTPAEIALFVVGLVATVLVTIVITRTAKRALNRKTGVGA